MNWNAKPESAPLPPPPPYPQSQLSLPPQYLVSQHTAASQSSFSYSGSSQEACMYPNNPNPVSQPVPSIRKYVIPPQIPASSMHNRTFVTSQRSVERMVCVSANGPRQPNHTLQTPSGVTQNVWSNSLVRNPTPSHTEVNAFQQTDFGTHAPTVHPPQSRLLPSDTCSMELQMNPSDSVRVPVTFQGNQGLNQPLLDGRVDWAQQYTFNELTYPDYRPQPKQYSHLPQSFPQDPPVQKQNVLPSPSFPVKNSRVSALAQLLQPTQTAAVSSYQCAPPTNKRPPPLLPYNCGYGSQPLQNIQQVIKHSPVDVPQSPEMHPSGVRKDFYKGFQQHWQNTNENPIAIGNFCDLKVNTNFRQPLNEPVRSNVDGVQTLAQNNQEKRMESRNPGSNQVLDANVAKENLVRDFKSLVKMKKKFSELARKIRISKDLLISAGCSKTTKISYSESAQPSQLPTKGTSAKSDSHCSVELLATCLSLWKKQPSQTTEEKALKPSEEKLCNDFRTNPTTVGISEPVEVHDKNPCSVEANSQNKRVKPPQETALSVTMQNNDSSSSTNVTKGTELQVAIVSPLILSNVNTLSVKGITPPALPETCVYPVIKEGSIFSLQSQLAENTTVTAALTADVSGGVASHTSAVGFPLVEVEKRSEPTDGHSSHTPVSSEGAQALKDPQTLCTSRDSAVVSGNTLQIENICSLVEGDVSYNSQIAKIFTADLLGKVEASELSPPNQPVTGQEKEQVDCVAENKDFGFRKDKGVQCTDVPQEITDESEAPEAAGSTSFECIETNSGVVEESKSGHTTEKDSTARDCPAAVQHDPSPQGTDPSYNATAQDPVRHEVPEGDTPAFYLHDQLSELVKEFPFGIEPANTSEGSGNPKVTGQISEDQTGGKSDCDSKDSTDQIKITILSSEQMRELFPEQDEPCAEDTELPVDAGKLAESQKEKPVAEGSPCDPQAPAGQESGETAISDSGNDTVHCCALGWLSVIYEGVPQCQCNSSKNSISEEEKGEDQPSPLQTSSCKQEGQRSSGRDVTIVELNNVSGTLKTPPAQVVEKGHLPETHRTKQNSSPKTEQELTGQDSSKRNSSDKKDASKTKQDSSLKMGHKSRNPYSSKREESSAVRSNKMKGKLKFHQVSFPSSDTMTVSCEQASQGSVQQKSALQNSHLLKAKTKELHRRNGSFVPGVSPEKKKWKFKVDGSQKKHLEKRKLDQGNTMDMEIKKKKYDTQEQNKNVGGVLKLCNTLSNPNERASLKERVSDPRSSDLKSSSSKFVRIITPKEYLERQKRKEMMGSKGAPKICPKNVPGDSESMRPSKFSLQVRNGEKSNERPGSSEEASKEPVSVLTSCSKNLKLHHSESKTYNSSKNGKGKVDGAPPDKMWTEKSKADAKLTSRSNEVEFRLVPPHTKEQRKSYLNRVGFKCTERESICLTAYDSLSQKLKKDKDKSEENKPKTSFSVKDATEKPTMLEFKLCPDVLLQNVKSVEGRNEPKPPAKEQAPVQVSGIKSTKEDWLKCATTKKRMHETSQETVDNPRLCKRSASADGFEKVQNPGKGSKAMFQTYKQMYLEKRSRSLGSSPVK